MRKNLTMKPYFKEIKLLSMLLISLPLMATESFEHHDWQVVCDNTNTCRVAGYSSVGSDRTVSVLLTRKAGENQAIKAEMKLTYYSEEDEKIFSEFPSVFKLEMSINGVRYGAVSIEKGELKGALSKKQTDALVASLQKKSKIIWKYQKYKWELSDKGSASVLLKMDEYQKRLNTVGASYRKGSRNEKHVLAPKAAPLIYAQKIASDKEIILSLKDMKHLYATLPFDKENCSIDETSGDIKLFELSSTKALASRLCWTAAYNTGTTYWIINKKQPFNPKLVTNDAIGFHVDNKHVGMISNAHKGRGIGDCWSHKDFVWDGERFQISFESTTGLCRGFAGGAWSLPTIVSEIKVK